MVISTITAMSTFHPEANPALTNQDVYKDEKLRNKQIHRLLGSVPTISAFAYRHRIGRMDKIILNAYLYVNIYIYIYISVICVTCYLTHLFVLILYNESI